MKARGRLRKDADPAALATATMASIQVGLLLTQVRRDPHQLRIALNAARNNLRVEAALIKEARSTCSFSVIPCSGRINSLFGLEKFPVMVRREFGCKWLKVRRYSRVLKEYGVSESTPESVERLPLPARPVPRQTAFALRIMFVSLLGIFRRTPSVKPRVRFFAVLR